MIDFDPATQIALMPQDVAMKFMAWAAYYKGLVIEPGKSFSSYTRDGRALFLRTDAERLDRLQDVLFKCFEPESVAAAMRSMRRAKETGEICPFNEASLDELFGTTL